MAHYRAVESDRADALFRDPLARLLTAERGERIARSFESITHRTAWSIVMRTLLIDDYIERAIADGVDAVVNIGAGLDTRPYRMALPAALQWVEADFPHLIEFKSARLQNSAPRCQLQRVGLDLSDSVARRRFLADVAPGAGKVLVLTEGVVPYLTEAQVAALAEDLLAQPRFACWLAEYFSPSAYPFLQCMAKTPMLANSPFQFFPENWTGFFLSHGWAQEERHYSMDLARRVRRMPPSTWWARLQLPFMSRESREQARTLSGFMRMIPRER